MTNALIDLAPSGARFYLQVVSQVDLAKDCLFVCANGFALVWLTGYRKMILSTFSHASVVLKSLGTRICTRLLYESVKTDCCIMG